jgi:UDP-glucose:(heptosyl)LPS alpha-1,3-glucosyltransferase
MNLAICHESVVPARGGCEVYIADLIRRLIADHHEVHLYADEREAAALPPALIFHAMMPRGGPRCLRPWRFARACERALQREKHDVVIGFMKTWYQDVLLPQGGLHLASAQGNLRKYRGPVARSLARVAKWLDPCYWSYALLERRQLAGRYQPLIIAVSRMVQEHLRHYYGVGGDRVRVIPNAIDVRRFAERDRLRLRMEVRQHLGLAPEDPVALFVGNNYRLKGLDPLLCALRELPSRACKLLVCGSRKSSRYERRADRLGVGDRVHFVGYAADIRSYFFAADFLVHPTFYDPCSLVVLEALACGLPVITSRYNGAAELLHPPRDGYVVDDPHDVPRLAHFLNLLCDPGRRAACAQAARQTAAAWTFDDHYRRLLEAFQEVMRRKQAA